ncbi:hypothetical protein, partial [Helicobacter pylori]
FIAHAPSDKNYRFMGTELDPTSASISKFLYPNQVIQNTALENNEIDARTFKSWEFGSKEASKENASMSEELTHKKLKEQNKQIAEQNKEKLDAIKKQFASNLN